VYNQFDGLYHHRDGSLEEKDGTIVSGANNYSYDTHRPLDNKLNKSTKKEHVKKHHAEEAHKKEESYPYGYIKAYEKSEPEE